MLKVVVMILNVHSGRKEQVEAYSIATLHFGKGHEVFLQTRNFCENLVFELDAKERRHHQVKTKRTLDRRRRTM